MSPFKLSSIFFIGFSLLCFSAQAHAQDVLNLEEPPPMQEQQWQVYYLKASYRSKYILRATSSFDKWGLPLNAGLAEEEKAHAIYHIYQADSKIQISQNLSSYLRFDYYFLQMLDTISGEYQDTPGVNLWEAYLDWQGERSRIRLGGQQLSLGKIDFRSPINILNLSNPDKLNHLDSVDNRYVMPIASYHKSFGSHKLHLYWAPFQRVSEEAQSLRGNIGLRFQVSNPNLTYDLGLFKWFDDQNQMSLESVFDPELEENKLTLKMEDSPIKFAFFDFDYSLNKFLLKGDFGYFLDKTHYHLYAPEGDVEKAELENLKLKEFAFALSLERKTGKLFWLAQFSSTNLYKVPKETLVLNFENLSQPATEERDLSQKEVALALAYDITINQEIRALVFTSTPFESRGGVIEWLLKDLNRQSFRFFISQTGTEVNHLSNKKTTLQRIHFELSLRI